MAVRHVASFDLGSSPALVEVLGSLLFSGVTGLDVVNHRSSSGSLSHARRRALMLDDVGIALPIRNPALHPDSKPILADLRSSELGPDSLFNLFILLSGRALWGRSLGRCRRLGSLARQDRCQK